ncbi:hypothetical protein NA57DRAFT_75456 [Rhizodiscina lignyota]|uniref:Zn(2)-C6 fungal-type domain-containing protein n=1 Tax=Rhizodiscina lignyota TaxID=1504668 RepID=A0A9P4M7G2_9PEZI|nr:hypothetical protein NA57DRAFT_75456 [Rhizodiscina lignyota]
MQCDERRPGCGRCASLKLECPGYADGLKFVDEGARLQKKIQKRSNSGFSTGRITFQLGRATATKAAITSNPSIGVPMPGSAPLIQDQSSIPSLAPTQGLPSSNTSPTESARPDAGTTQEPTASGASTFDTNSGTDPINHALDSTLSDSQGAPSSGISQSPLSRSFRLTGSDVSTTSLIGSNIDTSFHEFFSEFMLESEQGILFLLRHFADNIAPWVDLFSPGTLFGSCVLTASCNHAAIKYAAIAVAAKQLGLVGGIRAISGGGLCRVPASSEIYPNSVDVNWSYKAANYYHQALENLKELLPLYEVFQPHADHRTLGRDERSRLDQAVRSGQLFSGSASEVSDYVLIATSILHIYESLDSSDRHYFQYVLPF